MEGDREADLDVSAGWIVMVRHLTERLPGTAVRRRDARNTRRDVRELADGPLHES